jgi:hypothetical protein
LFLSKQDKRIRTRSTFSSKLVVSLQDTRKSPGSLHRVGGISFGQRNREVGQTSLFYSVVFQLS